VSASRHWSGWLRPLIGLGEFTETFRIPCESLVAQVDRLGSIMARATKLEESVLFGRRWKSRKPIALFLCAYCYPLPPR
jgi:hypothetical protein